MSTYTHHFRWDSSVPESVAIKGSFDNWQSSLELCKHPSGKFSAPIELAFGSKVTYKYVVDGTWRHNPNEPTETDSIGNINNVFQVPQSPSQTMDPATDSEQPQPNPTATMSSDALVNEPLENSQGIPQESKPKTDAESPPEMSIAFPTTSSDQVPELNQLPKAPKGTKRTTSLFSSATRFARPSQRTTSLFSSAPGTPTEKASPAGASVSNVVSALAGVAATAIPAAIYAVTGKDITQAKSKQAKDAPAAAETPQASAEAGIPQATDENSQKPPPNDVVPAQDATPQQPIQPTEPAVEPSPKVPDASQAAPLPANDASANPPPKASTLVDAVATHQALPEPSIPAPVDTAPGPAETKPAQTSTPAPIEPLPLNKSSPVPIVLTPPSAAPEASMPSAAEQPSKQPEAPAEVPNQATKQPEPPKEVTKQPEPSQEATKKPETPTAQSVVTSPPQPEEGKASPSSQNVEGETPARVSFSEERPSTIIKPSATPKRTSILIPSTPASPSRGNEETSIPSKSEQLASLGAKSSKRGEFARKTSGWRYSVGSIRSRRTSNETDRDASATHNPAPVNDNLDSSSPSGKRRSGIFQKIKSALSPHKHHNKSPTRYSNNNTKKRNSFGRTATITQD